jgi:hypothetical protein
MYRQNKRHAARTLGATISCLLLAASAAHAQISSSAQTLSLSQQQAPLSADLKADVDVNRGQQSGTTSDRVGPGWFEVGFALAGVKGEPQLSGSGELSAGARVQMSLSNAAENSVAALVVGLGSAPLPFKGGTVVPDLSMGFYMLLHTDVDGSLPMHLTWPAGIPEGLEIYTQYLIGDAAAVQGVAFSNALMIRT